ncbi:LLM class flavin-dependent oxidoreductase [Streptosporangium sp. NPDC051022]|uniref:LLM class flavin-dependent oxidoreductase n=1 Tax=Streptosporangium sp. NPDC051022 TaxID=3155752 RepID=UPI003415C4E6
MNDSRVETEESQVQVGVMVTSYNQKDWHRVLAGDYTSLPERRDVDIVDNTLALGEMVEPLGFDSLWCAEHYGSPYSMQSNPLQWLSYWAGRTERIDVGSAVLVLPWWQPMKLIHEIGMLDTLLKGRRFHVGLGRGVAAHEYEAFGIPREEARDRFSEMVEILKASDENECFSYEGRYYNLKDVSVRPRPRNKGRLFDNVKAAFNTPSSMQMAARLGLGQMFVAAETLDQMRTQVAKFNAIRAQQGHAPNQPTTMLYLHCSTDPEEIDNGRRYVAQQSWAARNHYAMWKNDVDFASTKGYEDYAAKFDQSKQIAEDEGQGRLKSAELVGTPDQLIEKIQALQEAISLEYLIVHPAHGGKSAAEAQSSLKLFAQEVLPVVQAMKTPLHEHNLGSPELLEVETVVGGAVG